MKHELPSSDDFDHLARSLGEHGGILRQGSQIKHDPSDDYVVVREVRVARPSPTEAQFVVFQTDKGAVGFGFEDLSRIGLRLGARGRNAVFADGFEPVNIDRHALELLVNAAAMGGINVFARKAFGHVLLCQTAVQNELRRDLMAHGVPGHWLKRLDQRPILTRKLTYDAWMDEPWRLPASR